MVGKNPHRPEGKANADNEHMQAAATSDGTPYDAPSKAEVHRGNMRAKEQGGAPSRFSAEEQVGGSRPGVHSRVKEAIEEREDEEAR